MTSNQFFRGGGFDGAGAFAFDRNRMLVGDPTAGGVYFNLNLASHPEGIFGMLPSDHDGLLPPPAGAPNVFVYFTDTEFGDPADGLRLFNLNFNTTTYAASTFVERPESTLAAPLPLAAFDARDPGGRGDIEQPPPALNNGTDRLDSVGSRLMFRLQYQNRGGVESLVSNFTVNVSGVVPTSAANYQAAFRYFELQKSSPGGSYAVTEQATFAPGAGNGATGDNRWMASAASDNQDNLLVGYSISGVAAGHFPSLNYAARAFSDPPNGLFQGEGTLFAGTGVQRGTGNRWGDYSSTQIDPTDDCTFWMANEYYTSTNSTFNWQTRIGKVKFASCTAPQQGTLAGTITACDTGAPLAFALVQVSGGPSDGFSTATIANGTYSMQLAPGTYSVNVSAAGHLCNPVGPFTAVIVNGATTTLDTCLSGQPTFVFQSAAVSGGNGNGVIDLNECNNLNVTIKNDGCLKATQVSAVLSSTTSGVTITQPNSPYPDTAENASSTNIVPFSVSTSPAFVCGTIINFTLTVSYTGGGSPNTLNFSLPSCQCPPTTINGALAVGDLTQTGRMGRIAPTSACGSSKTCPGAIAGDTAQHRYDIYSFTNGNQPACVTITTTANCSSATNPIITVAYLGSFNPSNLCTNYLGDLGGSPSTGVPVPFSVNVPANGVLLVNVHEITAGTGCSSYTLNVSGLVCSTDGGGQCVPCSIVCPANITQPNDPSQCGAIVTFAPTSTGTCGVVSCSPASGSFFPVGATTVTCNTTQGSSCTFTVTVNDTEPPVVSNPSASPAMLWPPNHTMRDVTVDYTDTDNCPGVNCALSVTSNEPVNGTGDGDTAPDWEIIDAHHLRLRAERAGTGSGRIYTITVTCTDAAGNATTKTTTVVVAHNISGPPSGAAFKVNTPVNFAGSFWDVSGKSHTAQWGFDSLTKSGTVVEPSGLTNGTVRGTYTFTAPGVYKVTMKVTDNTGVTSSVATAGDLEAIVVIYDPNGGYTIGGGWVPAAAGSYPANPGLTGKLSFGFNSKYTNATNPKGETQIQFALGNLEFNALNYDYLAISGARAQLRGFGKVNGDAGYNFILTVVDGQATGGGGVDKFRIKIWNKNTGAIVFDTQMGASDAADPTTPVGIGSSIVIQR